MEKKSKFLILTFYALLNHYIIKLKYIRLLIFSKGTNSNQENNNNYNNQNLVAVPGPTLMKKTTMGDKDSLKVLEKREDNNVTNDIRF